MERDAQRCTARRRRHPRSSSNIYLDRLDKFVETVLIPRVHPRKGRARNPDYQQILHTPGLRNAASGAPAERGDQRDRDARELRKQQRSLPSRGPCDPGYRRLRYSGTPTITSSGSPDPKPKPSRSGSAWQQFLRDDLKLELNQDKTLITHARTSAAQLPRLRDHRPARRREDHPRPASQRQDRAARPHGR